MKKKVMLVFGTRPEAIKMCPLVNELKKRETLETIVCVTGQHRQMLDQVLETFNVIPDYDLAIMKQGQTLFDITTGILEKIKAVLENVKPDIVLVHGDTTTTFVTALACFYLQIPVGHVEAGLRTYNIYSPYPEEFNRQAVGIISKYNFAPTELAKKHLLDEGKDATSIYVTGNTVIDAMQHTVIADYHHPELDWVGDSRMIFITAHPIVIKSSFSWLYVASLTVILSFTLFIQYFFSITYKLLLQADQKMYIVQLWQSLITLLNMYYLGFASENTTKMYLKL